jgi:hypothetical protein
MLDLSFYAALSEANEPNIAVLDNQDAYKNYDTFAPNITALKEDFSGVFENYSNITTSNKTGNAAQCTTKIIKVSELFEVMKSVIDWLYEDKILKTQRYLQMYIKQHKSIIKRICVSI